MASAEITVNVTGLDEFKQLVTRVAELEETAATTIAGHAQAYVDQGHQLDTALAALWQLIHAVRPYVTGAATTIAGQEMAAESELTVAFDVAVKLVTYRDGTVLVDRDDLSVLTGLLSEGDWQHGPHERVVIDRVAALLNPGRGTGRQQLAAEPIDGLVDGNAVRAATTVQVDGSVL